MKLKIAGSFREHSGAGAPFFCIPLWKIGIGCFAAAMNNFLADIYRMDSVKRGRLEFSGKCRD